MIKILHNLQMQELPFDDFIFCLKLISVPESLISSDNEAHKWWSYVLNIFNSIFCCPDIRQLQMIFTSQIILDISLSEYVIRKCWI